MTFNRAILLFSFFNFFMFTAFAQSNSREVQLQTYDALVSLENTGLYNGTEFSDLFLNTNGTYRYFKGFDYVKGSVTYNGQRYENVLLKYDLYEDNLLTRSDDNLAVFNVKLIAEGISNFTIHNHNFVRMDNFDVGISGNGFYEAAFTGNYYELYIKRTKRKKDRAVKSGIQYSFIPVNNYILKDSGKFTVVNSEKDLRKTMPENDGEIRNFYKSNKALYKSDPDKFMINLTTFLDGLKTQQAPN